jgi:hypothetical protein
MDYIKRPEAFPLHVFCYCARKRGREGLRRDPEKQPLGNLSVIFASAPGFNTVIWENPEHPKVGGWRAKGP